MEDLSYLDDVDTKQSASLMEALNTNVKRLRELQWVMLEAEEAYNKAKQEYEAYSRGTMPDVFKMNGLTSLMMENGQRVSVVTKTSASMKKDAASKKQVCEWLRSKGMDNLINEQCLVPITAIEQLERAGIAFEKDVSVNTNSIKAYLIDALGQKESPATITRDEIPSGINFFQWDEMEIS